MKHFLLLAAALGLVLGCGGSEGPSAEMTGDEARARASALIPEAKVKEVVKHPEPGIVHWMVTMTMPSGGELAVEYDAGNGELDEIEAEKGPFDYDLSPRKDVIKLSEARGKALAVKTGNIEVWEYQARKVRWEFYIRDRDGHLWEIIMGATDGKISTVVEKAVPD